MTLATGGNYTYIDNGDIVHVFSGSGTLNVIEAGDAWVLVVGQGGAGGGDTNSAGGGGGGGGVYENESFSLPAGSHAVVVGSAVTVNNQGDPSSLGDLIGCGGGGRGGNGSNVAGQPGASGPPTTISISGNGGGGTGGTTNATPAGGSASSPSFAGGAGTGSTTSSNRRGGGGGGAGAVGVGSGSPRHGGAGVVSDITGGSLMYGAGGGGAARAAGQGGTGGGVGSSGAGNGAGNTGNSAGGSGTPGRGGGRGGSTGTGTINIGSQGIVIIRYPIPEYLILTDPIDVESVTGRNRTGSDYSWLNPDRAAVENNDGANAISKPHYLSAFLPELTIPDGIEIIGIEVSVRAMLHSVVP